MISICQTIITTKRLYNCSRPSKISRITSRNLGVEFPKRWILYSRRICTPEWSSWYWRSNPRSNQSSPPQSNVLTSPFLPSCPLPPHSLRSPCIALVTASTRQFCSIFESEWQTYLIKLSSSGLWALIGGPCVFFAAEPPDAIKVPPNINPRTPIASYIRRRVSALFESFGPLQCQLAQETRNSFSLLRMTGCYLHSGSQFGDRQSCTFGPSWRIEVWGEDFV